MTHIFDEKKSAQIRLKIAPIAWTTSRVGQIWPQIVFLVFWKIQYLDSGCLQGHFSSHNLELYIAISVMFRSIVGSFKPQCLHIRALLACTYCVTMPHTDRIPCHVTGPYFRIHGAKDSQILCQTLAFQEGSWMDTLVWGLGMPMYWVLYVVLYLCST